MTKLQAIALQGNSFNMFYFFGILSLLQLHAENVNLCPQNLINGLWIAGSKTCAGWVLEDDSLAI